MIRKNSLIQKIENLTDKTVETAVVIFQLENQNFALVEGTFINICTMLADVALQIEDFKTAVIMTGKYLEQEGGVK